MEPRRAPLSKRNRAARAALKKGLPLWRDEAYPEGVVGFRSELVGSPKEELMDMVRRLPYLAFLSLAVAGPPSRLHALDCNQNGVEDSVEIEDGRSADCNRNGVPDECEIFSGGVLPHSTRGMRIFSRLRSSTA